MTTSDNDPPSRPISVAELLAKNGNIGSPPVGGRRRRRRGDTGSVTVAELTGEIPLIQDDPPPVEEHDADAGAQQDTGQGVEPDSEDTGVLPTVNGTANRTAAPTDPSRPVQAERPRPHERQPHAFEPSPMRRAQEAAPAPHAFDPRPASRTAIPPGDAPASRPEFDDADADADAVRSTYADGAEGMSFDPMLDEADPEPEGVVGTLDELDDVGAEEPAASRYGRDNQDTLFGGRSFADDVARGGRPLDDPAMDLELDLHADSSEAEHRGTSLVHYGLIIGQSILAVIFGAGMFLAFDQLWQWKPIVALVLSVLVILGLVVGVRVVRKTEDITSTLIAVAVGLLVCLGPLALLR
ncbi:MAG: hypothetical protein ACSLE6_19805 [Mycobacterium sp.]